MDTSADSIQNLVQETLTKVQEFINPRLESALTFSDQAAPRLVESMRHALVGAGEKGFAPPWHWKHRGRVGEPGSKQLRLLWRLR